MKYFYLHTALLIFIPAVQRLLTEIAMLAFSAGPLPDLREMKKCFDA